MLNSFMLKPIHGLGGSYFFRSSLFQKSPSVGLQNGYRESGMEFDMERVNMETS